MRFLLIGSGGREHALAWALTASPLVSKLYCAPGNPGIATVAECVPIAAMDFDGLLDFAKKNKIDFAVIGPETPLVGGLWDLFESAGIKALGPSKAASVLEGSKGFVKTLCRDHGIPTADFRYFTEPAAAKAHAARMEMPVVIKADGLAAGKGVIIAGTLCEAEDAIDNMFDGEFGVAGASVVIEEFLQGEEASFFVLSDGRNVLPLATAQDHKRAFDGDRGPNTGGMGAYSPAPVMTPDVIEKTLARIVRPTVAAMAARGTPYMGVLYAGLMIDRGEPKLIEYNCRFGDPECQVLLPRLKSDLAAALIVTREGCLQNVELEWRDDAALTVVMAAKGYPGVYRKGAEIRGIDEASQITGAQIFHAGTAIDNGRLVSFGGRVLDVTATGQTIAEAQRRAYHAVDQIDWTDGFCRRDIGWRAVAKESFN